MTMAPFLARQLLGIVARPLFRPRTPILCSTAITKPCLLVFSAQPRGVASSSEISHAELAVKRAKKADPNLEKPVIRDAESTTDFPISSQGIKLSLGEFLKPVELGRIKRKYLYVNINRPREEETRKYLTTVVVVADQPAQAAFLAADTMQRNFDTFSLPSKIHATKAVLKDDGLHVTWSHENHRSVYPKDFIRHYLLNDVPSSQISRNSSHVLWTAPEIEHDPPTVSFDEVMNLETGTGIAKLTSLIQSRGFAFVSNTPVSPDETQRLLEHIGPIRNTHYGGFYDFIPDLALADTAYTNLALPAHTDNTYFTEPAGLQAFHLLSHRPPPSAPSDAVAEGGKSLLVDGFKAAEILRQEDLSAFQVLTHHKLSWHASGNKGISISPAQMFPVLEKKGRNSIMRVRWNNDDRGVVPFAKRPMVRKAADMPAERNRKTVDQWYAAARKWNEIIKRKDLEYWVQLTPGNVLIFDNWRVLHGRSSFEGVRRICGGYINRDDFISRWRNTNCPREDVLRIVVG